MNKERELLADGWYVLYQHRHWYDPTFPPLSKAEADRLADEHMKEQEYRAAR